MTTQRKKLLFVDDHPLFREGVRSILSGLDGIDVVGEARRGGEACKMAEELCPDLVLMDISLPDMDGIDATRRIKKSLPGARVIIVSMHSKAAYIVDAFKAGATGYVTKDSTSLHLKECIETVLDGAYYLDPVLSEDVFQRILSQNAGALQSEDRVHGLLTSRELEITRLIADGHTIKRIAERLFISRKTVENHRANIYAKLGVHSTVELVRHAIKLGIIDIERWKE